MEENRLPGARKRKRWWLWLLSCLLVFGAAAGSWLYWLYREYQPPARDGQHVSVTVQRGESVMDVGQTLLGKGLVRNSFVFRLYVSWHHLGRNFQAGQYDVVRGTGIPEIVSQLTGGDVVDPTVSVTIPEGFSVMQIAQRLQDKHICSKTAFLDAVQHDTFTEPFLKELSADPKIKYRLEGYLFPDTYRFKPGTPAHDVVDEMLQAFASRVDSQVLARIHASGKSLPHVITEASMIEKEAKVDSERPLIASVIVNRLRIHMKLQMDCTLQYILGHQEMVTNQDTKVVDPYNTYLNPGLPPGPIASPGMPSILAAISPAKTDYLYYVVKNDGTGSDYFAKTYQEQLHNETLSQQNLKKHEHG